MYQNTQVLTAHSSHSSTLTAHSSLTMAPKANAQAAAKVNAALKKALEKEQVTETPIKAGKAGKAAKGSKAAKVTEPVLTEKKEKKETKPRAGGRNWYHLAMAALGANDINVRSTLGTKDDGIRESHPDVYKHIETSMKELLSSNEDWKRTDYELPQDKMQEEGQKIIAYMEEHGITIVKKANSKKGSESESSDKKAKPAAKKIPATKPAEEEEAADSSSEEEDSDEDSDEDSSSEESEDEAQ